LSRPWLHAFRSFTTPRSLFDCLVDGFGKPLCRFNALASLERLSGSQRNAIVSRTRTQVCYVLDSWLRHCAKSDFLADSELFSDCCAFLAQERRLAQRPVGQLQQRCRRGVGELQQQRRRRRPAARAAAQAARRTRSTSGTRTTTSSRPTGS
jgi:hypothetical protein